MFPKVTIVILNWNGKSFLQQFIPGVLATDYSDFEVLVVDNASTDDSLEFLKSQFPDVRRLALDRNYGFTTGNNLALPHVHSPYFVLLNNDVEVQPGWLKPLVELMERNPDVAACQPKLLSHQNKGEFEYAGAAGGWIDCLGYPFTKGRIFETNEPDHGQYDGESNIFWATGACMMVRKSVTDQLGLFEDDFFAHMEEIDFCWRAQNHGFRIMSTTESVVYHVGGGTLPKSNPRKTYLNAHNSLVCLLKNFPASQMPFKLFARLCLDGVWAFRALTQFDFKTIGAIAKAHWALFFRLGFWLKRRNQTYRGLSQIRLPQHGYLPRSIVFQYFLKGKRRFQDLVKPVEN